MQLDPGLLSAGRHSNTRQRGWAEAVQGGRLRLPASGLSAPTQAALRQRGGSLWRLHTFLELSFRMLIQSLTAGGFPYQRVTREREEGASLVLPFNTVTFHIKCDGA